MTAAKLIILITVASWIPELNGKKYCIVLARIYFMYMSEKYRKDNGTRDHNLLYLPELIRMCARKQQRRRSTFVLLKRLVI